MRRRERDSYDVTDSPAAAFFKRTFTPGLCLTLLISTATLLAGTSRVPFVDRSGHKAFKAYEKEYRVPMYPNGLPRVTLRMRLSQILGRPVRSSVFPTDDFEPDRPGFD